MKNHVFSITLSQRKKRFLVILIYSVLSALLVLWLRTGLELTDEQIPPMEIVTILGFLIMVVGSVLLNMSVQLYATPKTDWDERQKDLRIKANAKSYRVFGVSLLAAYIFSDVLGMGWSYILVAFLYISLPTAFLAWLEPDPVQNDAFHISGDQEATT